MHFVADTISTTALATLFGASARSITDLAKRGIIVRARRGYALAASVQRYCAHLRELATDAAAKEPLRRRRQSVRGWRRTIKAMRQSFQNG
jgi:phage terminase Nu1 subunit (DNA packaging protein)